MRVLILSLSLFLLFFRLFLQYAIKLATKLNEKRLSSITELTTLEDKPIKLLDTGQRDKDRDKDRDCEREWNHKQHNHITNNHHQQSVVNHTSHVSFFLQFFFSFLFFLTKVFGVVFAINSKHIWFMFLAVIFQQRRKVIEIEQQ